jgi:hypothetical protein
MTLCAAAHIVANGGSGHGADSANRLVRPRELDHLGALLDVFCYGFAVLSWRTCKRRVAKARNPRFHRGIDESGIDLLIERCDDVGGRVLWRANTQQYARIVTRQKIAQ